MEKYGLENNRESQTLEGRHSRDEAYQHESDLKRRMQQAIEAKQQEHFNTKLKQQWTVMEQLIISMEIQIRFSTGYMHGQTVCLIINIKYSFPSLPVLPYPKHMVFGTKNVSYIYN